MSHELYPSCKIPQGSKPLSKQFRVDVRNRGRAKIIVTGWLCSLSLLIPVLARAGQPESEPGQSKQPDFPPVAFPDQQANQIRYLKKALAHPDVEVRKQAIEQISRLDAQPRQIMMTSLIEPLAGALKQPETREQTADLLEQLGYSAIPAFAPLLESDQHDAKVRSAVGVMRILKGETFRLPYESATDELLARAQRRAMEILLNVLADPIASQWRVVAESAQYFPLSERYRPAALLLETLHSGPQREWAANSLAWMDSHGLPALVVAANSDEEAIRTAAIEALATYGIPEDAGEAQQLLAVMPVFENARNDTSREVSMLATRGLSRVKSLYVKRKRDRAQQNDRKAEEARELSQHALLQFLGIDATDPKTVIPRLAERVFDIEKTDEGDRLLRHFATQALASFGKPARPHLLKGLKHEDPYVRSMTIEAVGDHQPDFQEAIPLIIDALGSEESRVRNNASRAIAKMNPTDKELLKRLEKALDEDTRGVPQALAQFGPVIAPRLLERIQNPDNSGAEAAVRTFAQLEQPPSEEVIKQLIDLLGSENERVLHRARRCLEGGWSFTRPYVLKALKEHQNPQVRQFAIQILRFGKLGHTWSRGPVIRSAPDLPHLLEALKDPHRNVRIGAAQSLAIVAPGVARWSPVMRKLVPELGDALVDEKRAHGLQPIIPLEVLGDHAKEAIPQVVKLLRTDPNQARMFLRERGETAVPALREVLRSDDRSWRLKAIEVLRQIGSPAKSAAQELISLAKEGDLEDRLLAARALAAIGAAPDVALAIVQEVLENRRRFRFWEDRVLDTLVELVRIHPPAVPVLVPLLTGTRIDRESNREIWYVEPIHLMTLGRTAHNVPDLIGPLKQVALRHHDGGREAAFVALQQLNPEAATEIAPQYHRELAKKKAEERNRR